MMEMENEKKKENGFTIQIFSLILFISLPR